MSRERKLPAVPAISSKVPREIAQVLGPLKQIVEALQQGGMISAGSGGATTPGSTPTLPDTVVSALVDATTPPAPTGMAVHGGMALIIIEFDKAAYRNHSHTEIWRADSNDFSLAVMVGTSQANVYTDAIGGSRVAWYWLRHVSSSTPPRHGPFNSQTGTRGETGQDATYVLDLVKGKLQDVHIAQVNAAKVIGTLKDWQIEAVSATKIAGQLADSQLANISTAKLLGQIEMTQLSGAVQGNISSAIHTANQALSTANQAASATSVSQLSAKVDALSNNLLPVDLWKPGLAGLPSPWVNNWNDNAEQTLVSAAGPYGDITTVLKAISKWGGPDGGWDINVPIDKTKAYRFSVWVNKVSGNGTVYFGIGSVQRDGSYVPNPYFMHVAASAMPLGKWVLFVGYVFPYNASLPTGSKSAAYVGETGDVLTTGVDYAWDVNAIDTNPRCYQYYSTDGSQQLFAHPRFEVIDGREPSISELLSGTALTTSKAAITRVANVEVAVAGKASAIDVANLQARVATAEAGIVAANQARADGDASSASSISQVNARMAPGGDIYGALQGKAAQASLDATNTRISAVETLANGKASASEVQSLTARISGSSTAIAVPGTPDKFYPVGVYVKGSSGAVTRSWRVSRPAVHENGQWLGSYVAEVTLRVSDWGNAPKALISVHQRSGAGAYTWGLGDAVPSYVSNESVLFLRGGMTHTVELLGTPGEILVEMPGADGVLWTYAGWESFGSISESESRLKAYLDKDWRPDGTLAKESIEALPQALNDITAQNTRLTNAEVAISGKASASTVESLQVKANRRKSYRVVSWGNSYDYRYGSETPGLSAADGSNIFGYARSYAVVRFAEDGSVAAKNSFDVYGETFGSAAGMAAHLNAMPLGTLVLIYSCDEPASNRTNGGLPDAIYRCGGTEALFLHGGGGGFAARSAYVLLGKISGKQGTAFEAYRGDMGNDPAAYIALSFSIENGEFVGISPAANVSAGAILNRVQQVEVTVGGKASSSDVSALQARIGNAEASVTTIASAQANLAGQVSGKWGVAIEATLPDGRKKLSGLQAFNDGSTAAFVITADQLLVQSTGAALNPDPGFADPSAWMSYSAGYHFVTLTDGKVGTTALRSDIKAEITGARPLPFDPSKTYRVKAWARGLAGANGTLYLGVQLLDGNGQNINGNGTFWYTSISAVGPAWTEFNGSIGPGTNLITPPNARSFRPIALVNYDGTTGYMELQDLRVEEVIPGTLIKPGEITTAHLVSQAVTAEKLAAYSVDVQHMRAGAVTADKLAADAVTARVIKAGEIQTAHLAAQSITADKLNVASLSAVTANIGLLRTAASGARMELESNQLRVYDANNVLRVRMGVWQ